MNQTIINGRLSFGRHEGKRLEDIPVEYLLWLRRAMKEESIVSEAAYDELLRRGLFSPQDVNGPARLSFGKYAGWKLSDVPLFYLRWLVRNFKPCKIRSDVEMELANRDAASTVVT